MLGMRIFVAFQARVCDMIREN